MAEAEEWQQEQGYEPMIDVYVVMLDCVIMRKLGSSNGKQANEAVQRGGEGKRFFSDIILYVTSVMPAARQ